MRLRKPPVFKNQKKVCHCKSHRRNSSLLNFIGFSLQLSKASLNFSVHRKFYGVLIYEYGSN